jgi:hypothetical protein
MNERILELAEQAGFIDFTVHNRIESKEQVLEKFAELIVRECAGIIESQDVDPAFKLRMSWAVRAYFGVKE